MKLSLCMIVKNEEKTLKRCLDSIREAIDEIVIVDTGSDDRTEEIARQYTEHVSGYPWHDDFSAARNASFTRASGDYLMWMDADDILAPEDRECFKSLQKRLEQETPDIVFAPYVSADGKLSYLRERIVRRGAGFTWTGRVHECIAPHGMRIDADFRIRHTGGGAHGMRNLQIYRKWMAEEHLSPRDLFYYGRELYWQKLYCESAAILEEMLAGDGWYVNKIEACRILAGCRAARSDRKGAIRALLKSFEYGLPRGGTCYELGAYLRAEGHLNEAIFWQECALSCPDRSPEGDFDRIDERTLFPLLELVCCHYALGDIKSALACHLRAKAIQPDHPAVTYNEIFFRSIGQTPLDEPDAH